jgi:hypothetical protein
MTALAANVAGCAMQGFNRYLTPRPVPAKKVSGSASMAAVGYSGDVDHRDGHAFGPLSPSLGGRVGVGGWWDAGIRIATGPLGVMADMKPLLFRSQRFDVAVSPAFGAVVTKLEWTDSSGYVFDDTFYFLSTDVPAVLGINVARELTIVLTPGFIYGWQTPSRQLLDESLRFPTVSGIAPRAGIGLDVGSEKLRARPEATFVWSTGEGEQRTIYTVGVALEFGGFPERSDISLP